MCFRAKILGKITIAIIVILVNREIILIFLILISVSDLLSKVKILANIFLSFSPNILNFFSILHEDI
jgi:hypothetical protein